MKSVSSVFNTKNKEKGQGAKYIKVEDLPKFINKNILPKALYGLNTKTFPYVPPGAKPLEYFTRVKFTSDEVKAVYQTFAVILYNYWN